MDEGDRNMTETEIANKIKTILEIFGLKIAKTKEGFKVDEETKETIRGLKHRGQLQQGISSEDVFDMINDFVIIS